MKTLGAKHYLISLSLRRERVPSFTEYPYCLPVVRNLFKIEFHPNVTFIVGENGTGKSTFLEAIAVACGFNAEGGTRSRGLKRPRDGFFLRAESFFNVATEIERLDSEPAPAPPIIDSYGGRSLHEQSHGEAFFSLFTKRFGGDGLYLLDEP
jgi:predicted ATPase